MSTLPLHWSIDVHSIHTPVSLSFEADGPELEALKRYAEVEAVTSFKSQLKITPLSAGKFKVKGSLQVEAVQASVVDLSAVPASIDEDFNVEFWPQELAGNKGEKAVSFEEQPPELIVGGRIPIGEFLCELFSVSLDPYPRNADDRFSWDSGEKESHTTPFGELMRLRQKKPGEA